MSTDEMIHFLKMFFDGTVLSASEVIYLTGLPKETAEKVYEAINQLRNY